MNKRICSLETEYALISNLLTEGKVERQQLADRLENTLLNQHTWVRCNSFGRQTNRSASQNLVELREGYFITNGSRFYYDVGHMEWANPETADPFSAVLYDRAAESNLVKALDIVNRQIQATHPQAWVMLVKNNIGYHGNASYGCHENYSLQRFDQQGQDVFNRLADDLIPFLVTRQLFCGAGRIGTRVSIPHDPTAFQLSQRADFVVAVESSDTRNIRSLLNLRDEPLADSQKWRRLHLILGDSNISEYANFLKLGTTCLVLDLLEANLIQGRWAVQDPIDALHSVSRHGTATQICLGTRKNITALEIQQGYLALVRTMIAKYPANYYGHRVVKLWQETLDDLAQNHPRLGRHLDWAIKRRYLFDDAIRTAQTDWSELGHWCYIVAKTQHIPLTNIESDNILDSLRRNLISKEISPLRRYANQNGLDWRLYIQRRILLSRLCEMDFRYHDIDPKRSLFQLIAEQSSLPRLISPQEIEVAQTSPPQDTRAWLRNQFILRCQAQDLKIEMDWDKIFLVGANRVLKMPDPFDLEQINLNSVPELNRERPILINILGVEDLRKN